MALWLQEEHGVKGLFDRMKGLSETSQQERAEAGADAQVRVLILALKRLADGREAFDFATAELATLMNQIAQEEGLTDEGDEGEGAGQPFTNNKKLGWLLKQQRFKRPKGKATRDKRWATSAAEVEQLARAFNFPLDEAGPG